MFIRIVALLLFGIFLSAPAGAAEAVKRIGIINFLDHQYTHWNYGLTRFGSQRTMLESSGLDIPNYIDRQLKEKLVGLGYEVQYVDVPDALREGGVGFVSYTWGDYRLSGKGKRALQDIIRGGSYSDLIIVQPVAKVIDAPGISVSGYGLYTRGSTSKAFGYVLGYVVRGEAADLIATSTPLGTKDFARLELTKETIMTLEPEIVSFADQVVSGLMMYFDGTFQY